MGKFTSAIHVATKVDNNLYSKAEDIANKMRIATGRGDDTRRHFMKRGVKKEELKELGLTELFKKEKVTQQEVLNTIAANRIELEEKIYRTGFGRDLEFGKEIEDLDIQQAYGPDYASKEAFERLREDTGLTSEANYFEWQDILPKLPNYADSSELPRLENQWELYKRGEWIYEDLDQDIKDVLMDKVAEEVAKEYYEDPLQRMTLTVVDQNAESTDVATKTSFNFSYSLVGNDSSGWRLADKEAESFKNGFGSFNVGAGLSAADLPSANEAEVWLRGLARSEVNTGGMDLGSLGKRDDTRWEDNTLDGGENYQERRFGLVGPKRFSEGVHFADDINNIFHIRTKDREGPNGEKILYVEELQSDWAQQGRKKGFYDAEKVKAGEDAAKSIFKKLSSLGDTSNQSKTASIRLQNLQTLIQTGLDPDYKNQILESARELRSSAEQQRQKIVSAGMKSQKQAILDYFTPEQKMQVAQQQIIKRINEFGISSQDGPVPPAQLGFAGAPTPEAVLEIRMAELVDNPRALDQVVFNAFKQNNKLKERVASDVSARLEAAGEDLSLESGGKTGLAGYFHRKASEQAADQLEEEGIPRDAFERIDAALEKYNPDTGFNSFGESTPMIGDGTRVPGITVTGLAEKQGDLPKAGPFVMKTEDWNKLAVKRIFQVAKEEGYDGVSFTPAEVHIDRWGDEELRSQYEKSIPSAVRKVVGKVTPKPDRQNKMEVEGYESPIYFLDDVNADGDTLSDKVSGPLPMFSTAPIGIAALQGLSPEEAQAEQERAKILELSFPESERTRDGIMALSGAPPEPDAAQIQAGERGAYEAGLDALMGIVGPVTAGTLGGLSYLTNLPERTGAFLEESILGTSDSSRDMAERDAQIREDVGAYLNYEPKTLEGQYASERAQEGVAALLNPVMENFVNPFVDYASDPENVMDDYGLNLIPSIYQTGKFAYDRILGEPEKEFITSATEVAL